ncbi:hypothetical protein [Lutibaculum baratangense]|uniref:hypothetical protein n=1 Tax=Lutibaculum baratangense TaxID=1358440 RepID=UPI00058B0B5D|nr:hypothetical protein [Lutibaculum baratangense]
MRRVLPALLAFVRAVTTSFGWMPSGHVADTGMDMTAAVGSADQAEPAGHADVALDGYGVSFLARQLWSRDRESRELAAGK